MDTIAYLISSVTGDFQAYIELDYPCQVGEELILGENVFVVKKIQRKLVRRNIGSIDFPAYILKQEGDTVLIVIVKEI